MTEKGNAFFESLYSVARMVNSSLEMSTVLEKIVQGVAEVMGVKAASIRILDARAQTLIMGAAHGLSDEYIRKGPVLVEESRLDRNVLKGKTVFIEDAQNDPDFQYGDGARAEGIVSVLVMPLMVGDKAIGVLRVYADKVRKFGDDEQRFVEAVADLCAIALENARLHQALQTNYDLLIAHKYRIDDN